jgi:hypothetical protein
VVELFEVDAAGCQWSGSGVVFLGGQHEKLVDMKVRKKLYVNCEDDCDPAKDYICRRDW